MQKRNIVTYIRVIIILIPIILGSCKEKHTPKPRGFFRIDLPDKEYTKLEANLPYTFNYASCAKIEFDNSKNGKNYWINIEYPEINGKIHISYLKINKDFDQIIEDTRKLAYKHSIKADAINEKVFSNPEKHVHGILYEIEGNAASSVQFFLTDSIDNYLRGALYFASEPNKDSLAPVINFVKEDIKVLIESFEWN
jgi:gliding motility-associated lipoprotein GldD